MKSLYTKLTKKKFVVAFQCTIIIITREQKAGCIIRSKELISTSSLSNEREINSRKLLRKRAYLVREAESWIVLMHDPIGLHSIRNATVVENQSFLRSNLLPCALSRDCTIPTSAFPVSGPSSPVSPLTFGVLVIATRKEITLWIIWLNCW